MRITLCVRLLLVPIPHGAMEYARVWSSSDLQRESPSVSNNLSVASYDGSNIVLYTFVACAVVGMLWLVLHPMVYILQPGS